MAKKRRKTARGRGGKKGKKSARRGGALRKLAVLTLLVAVGAAVGYYAYRNAAPETQRKVELAVLEVIDLGRRTDGTPEPLRKLLDMLADEMVVVTGDVVDAGELSGDTDYLIGGVPEGIGNVRLLRNAGYLVGYDEGARNPAWVAYRLVPGTHATAERPDRFLVDRRTTARVDHDDYTNSGYDRGHMAPNYGIAVVHGEAAQMETFLMSNIVPQKPDLNRELWRELEQKIANSYTDRYEEVWVVTGPLYSNLPERLNSGVMVPEAFFKIVIDQWEGDRGLRALAFVIPQNVTGEEPLSQFMVTIDEIERRSGFDFLGALEDIAEERLESRVAGAVW